LSNKFPDISVEDFDFSRLVKEILDMLTGKTGATEKRALLYEEFYPNSVLEFDEIPLMPSSDPTNDYNAASKKYVDKMDSSFFLARIY